DPVDHHAIALEEGHALAERNEERAFLVLEEIHRCLVQLSVEIPLSCVRFVYLSVLPRSWVDSSHRRQTGSRRPQDASLLQHAARRARVSVPSVPRSQLAKTGQ